MGLKSKDLFTINGRTQTLKEWVLEAKSQGVDVTYDRVYERILKYKWDPEKAIFTDKVYNERTDPTSSKNYIAYRWSQIVWNKKALKDPKNYKEPKMIWYQATSHSGYYVKNPRYKDDNKRIS